MIAAEAFLVGEGGSRSGAHKAAVLATPSRSSRSSSRCSHSGAQQQQQQQRQQFAESQSPCALGTQSLAGSPGPSHVAHAGFAVCVPHGHQQPGRAAQAFSRHNRWCGECARSESRLGPHACAGSRAGFRVRRCAAHCVASAGAPSTSSRALARAEAIQLVHGFFTAPEPRGTTKTPM